MKLSGWGRYPVREAELVSPSSIAGWRDALRAGSLCIRGMGRSYGDSSIAPRVVETRFLDRFIDFDHEQGVIACGGGVTLRELMSVSVKAGWCLPVTPGTSWVTVGGAIASDVHGKNHHVTGTFGQHVTRMGLLLGTGEIREICPQSDPELFAATCGGMGLTGVVLWAELRLSRVHSGCILETKHRTHSLEETCDLFNTHQDAEYSVAWVDGLSTGRQLGRGIFSVGCHATDGPLNFEPRVLASVPVTPPFSPLSRLSMGLFNQLYFRIPKVGIEVASPLTQFFYPLDALGGWNRLYGRAGFVQYQFVVPVERGVAVMRSILERLASRGHHSYLAVLKLFGDANSHWLSFPMRGYALALDFKFAPNLLQALAEADQMVLAAGGRVYLAKDSSLNLEKFRAMYPRWAEFEALRHRVGAIGVFQSDQSRRLGFA
jgi:decaprenylphospho-beta-D-ribofuranose 2-oxidase